MPAGFPNVLPHANRETRPGHGGTLELLARILGVNCGRGRRRRREDGGDFVHICRYRLAGEADWR